MAESHAHLRRQNEHHHSAKMTRMGLRHERAHGGRVPEGDEAQDRKMIKAAVHKHERHDHPGKPLTKLKRGGAAEGEPGRARADHRALGGRTKGHGGKPRSKGKASHVAVNVITGGGHPPMPMPVPVPGPAAGAPPPRPPVAPPPGAMPGGPPPGGLGAPMGGMPPGAGLARPPIAPPAGMPLRAAGGRIGPKMTAGSRSGVGRLEKAAAEEKRPPMRESHGETEKTEGKRRGGAC